MGPRHRSTPSCLATGLVVLAGMALLAMPPGAAAQDAPPAAPPGPSPSAPSPSPAAPVPSPPAAGAEPAAPAAPATPAPDAPPPAAQRKLDKGSFFRLMGQDVKGPSDIVVAQLVNVLVDAQGQPVGAVLDYGGFLGVGKRRLAVAWEAISVGAAGIRLSLNREQLRAIPDFKEGEGAVLAAPPAVEPSAPAGDTPAVQ
jgi:hypothetical protein